MKAAAPHPATGMKAATAAEAADMHAAATEAATATPMKTTTSAAKTATAATVETTPAASMTAATAAITKACCMDRICEWERRDRDRKERGERERGLSAEMSWHVFLHQQGAAVGKTGSATKCSRKNSGRQ
jgi:hypothetical protein